MAQLLHTSDTHLGYRQYHLDERREDFADAFAEVITAAIEYEVDAVVHAGDLFHTSRPGITPLQTVLTELQRLRAAEIPFLAIVGNHERTHDRNWIELLQEVGLATRLDAEGTHVADTTIYGLDYVPPGQRDSLDYQFSPPQSESAILVAHGLFTPFGHADWNSEEILVKSPITFDLMLVGDDHSPSHAFVGGDSHGTDEPDDQESTEQQATMFDLQRRVPISYAGSTERTKADQRQPRTYSLVTVPSEGDVDPDEHIERVEIESAREFVYVDVQLHRGEGLETVERTIREEVESLDGAVLKVTIMAAEEPAPPELTGDSVETTDDEPDVAMHERIPEGPIENLGEELGALVTRVSDRRDFFDDDREYQTVEFADIDSAVQERRREMTVSGPADRLLEIALDTDRFPNSRITDTAEETVTELLEDIDLDSFHVDDGGDSAISTDLESDQSGTSETESDDTAENELPEEALEELTD